MLDLLTGYQRPDGRWGFRDHVLVLPTNASANGPVERIAAAFGAIGITHDWVGRPGDPDADRACAVFTGFADHPNVRAALLVGVDDDVDQVLDALRGRHTPSAAIRLRQSGGRLAAVNDGVAVLKDLLARTPPGHRVPAPPEAIVLGLECGGSDALSGITANPALGVASDQLAAAGAVTILAEITEIIGAEHLLARRAVTADVAARVLEVVDRFERDIARFGVDFRGSQPTPGNIEGGLTTIEEKSLGAARKGGDGPLVGVLDYAERPTRSGLHLMDTPGQDIEQMTGMVAAGANLVAFTSGRGTPTGSPIAPCIKISTNTPTFQHLPDLFDLDAGGIATGTNDLASVGAAIVALLVDVANGAQTRSEHRGNIEFAVSRIRQDAAYVAST